MRSVTLPRYAGVVSCLLFLSGCAVGKDYNPPKNDMIDEWGTLQENTEEAGVIVSKAATLPSGAWWEQFGDETLSALVRNALANNNELKVAQARIAEARADENFAGAQLYPQINADANISRASLDSIASSKPDTIRQAGVSGNWDIDLFGGNRRRSEAAAAIVEASEEDFAQTRLNLIAEVARNYAHLRSAQMQRELTLRNLDSQRGTLDVTKALRKAQNVTELDVARVQAQISATEARLPQIRTNLEAAMNRLCVLTGQQPSALRELLATKEPLLTLPENVVMLSPVSTIAQRPDVRASERRLAQASALSNAAFAELFPKLSLSAFFGTRRSDFFGVLSPWSATAGAIFPLLDFGRIRSQMHGADARQEQAFYLYKQTVLLALEDVENSLSAYQNEATRSVLLQNVASEQARAATIASEQYKGGIVTQLDLLDAQRNQLDAEFNWVLSLQATTDNLIALYHALGQGSATL